MPYYHAKRIRLGKVEGETEFESPTDDLAYSEAHEGLDWKTEWAEVKRLSPEYEISAAVKALSL